MEHVLYRVISLVAWAALLVLGAFGIYFSFANYPAFGIVVTLAVVLLVGYSERSRRQRQRAAETARSQRRARSQDPLT